MGNVKERNSSIEGLRLILMVLIVVHHCIVHGLGLSGLSNQFHSSTLIPDGQMGIAFSLNALCICAVNCFVLISGYFKIKVSSKKFLDLIITLLLYTLLFSVIPYAIRGEWHSALRECLFLSHSRYWFVIDYLFLMAFAPVLNIAYDNFCKYDRRLFTLALVIITCYFGFIWGHKANINGYTVIQFITMYCVGRELAISNISFKQKYSVLLYILPSLVCAVSGWLLWYKNYYDLAWKTTYYNNPLLILSAIGMFMIFRNLNYQSSAINRIAKSALGIYLFQSSASVSYLLYNYIKESVEYFNGGIIFLAIIVISLIVCTIAIAIDQLRLIFMTLVNKCLLDRRKFYC